MHFFRNIHNFISKNLYLNATLYSYFSKRLLHPKSLTSLYESLCQGDRGALSRAITLVESKHPSKRKQAATLLKWVLKNSRSLTNQKKPASFRIGLSGPPGAGKSTFIEVFGKDLTNKGHKIAVLAVDPSSSTTGGSLLGDKTRMSELSKDNNAFIRPSPASGCLGGVTRNTQESIALCEAAGYDTILVETVGVGQSEFHVSYMVDMFILIVSPAGGDELQGLKRGIIEVVDLLIVNKADGDLVSSARRMQSDYMSAFKFLPRRFKAWKPSVIRVSSKTKEGLDKLESEIASFQNVLLESGEFQANRRNQYKRWMWFIIENSLLDCFQKHPKIQPLVTNIDTKVQEGELSPGEAADKLLETFFKAS